MKESLEIHAALMRLRFAEERHAEIMRIWRRAERTEALRQFQRHQIEAMRYLQRIAYKPRKKRPAYYVNPDQLTISQMTN